MRLVPIALFALLLLVVVGAGGKVCPALDIRNNAASLEKLRGCTVVAGHLHMVLIDTPEDGSAYERYSFPELTEIVDYLLVFKVSQLASLGKLFPNLRVIRGRKLFVEYALVLYRVPHLQEIGLYNLQYIGRGGVIVDSCPNVCYVRTIDWQGIGASKLDFPLTEASDCKDQECDASCQGYCWNNVVCQKRTFDYCEFFVDEGKCVTVCPRSKVANYETMKCMTREDCETILNGSWWVFNGTCIGECPIFYERDRSVEGGCRYVGRNFTKYCEGGLIDRLDLLEEMEGCTHINGSLEIRIANTNLERQLEEYLGDIVSISGYLKIGRSKAITSLEFLKNLTIIKGEQLDNNKYSLFVYENENLRRLWNFDDNFKLTIPTGILAFHDNPLLCLSEIEKFENSKGIRGKSDKHISQNSNGYKSFCNQKDLNITIIEKNPTNITIAWERKYPSDEMIIGYTIYYMSAWEGNVNIFSTSHSSDACAGDAWEGIFVRENQLQLKDLYPYTRYAFYIKTYTTAQQAEQTPINYFITESSEPSEPIDVVAEALNHTSILLKWLPPYSRNGFLSHYMVLMFVQKDYLPTIQQRNYCEYPHVLEVKEEETTTAAPVSPNVTKTENCTCPQKTFTEVITEDIECMESNKLETCMKNVYHPESDPFPAMEEVHKTIRKREMVVENGSDVVHTIVPANQTWYTFEDLNHFAVYIFYVQACNTKDSGEAVCGKSVMASQRTKKKESADSIRDVRVRIEEKNAFVEWSQLEETNSALVAYQIEYKRTDSEYSKPRFECITEEQYQSFGRVFKILKLSPGKYAIHVQAISLAGPGVFSEWEYFEIAAERTSVLPIVLPICAVFIVVFAAAVVCILYRRKRARLNNHLITSINPDYAGPVYVEDQWEIDRDDIELIKEIGGGTFGMVYQGVIKSRRYPCAIKTINSDASMSDRMEFLNEGSVMKTFSDAHHVVRLLGIVSRGPPPLVVMELMERGDLKSYLRRCREPSQSLPTNEMYRMAAEIADGMAYLSAKKFVHRDLAARNCMVAADHTVKIGDFGMARDVYETDYYRKGTAGLLPVRWMAPESLADGVFTTDSDVWSYGVVLWEMATYAEQPYQGSSNEEVFNFVKGGGKLGRPRECSDFFFEVMDGCWRWRPIERPTFQDIVNMLLGHVGEGFKVAAFCFSRHGMELRLNAGPRVYNPPALMPEHEEDYFGHYDASEEEVNLYMRDPDRPMSYLPSSRHRRRRSSPYHISPGSPSSTFSFDSS